MRIGDESLTFVDFREGDVERSMQLARGCAGQVSFARPRGRRVVSPATNFVMPDPLSLYTPSPLHLRGHPSDSLKDQQHRFWIAEAVAHMRCCRFILTATLGTAISSLISLHTSSTLSLGLSLVALSQPAYAASSCGHGSKCPSSSPCCSADGACGSGSAFCAGGCQALWSNSPGSCLPNPVCQNLNVKINSTQFNDTNTFVPILHYNGDASKAPFTLDYGSLGAGSSGVLVQMTQARQGKISTTNYCLYCEVSFTLRHNPRNGLVAAAIGMSDAKDELDWEFTKDASNQALSNWFSLGQVVPDSNSDGTHAVPGDGLSDFHVFGINWQSDSIQWKIDGNVVRTLTASQMGSNYPTTPMRFQVSTWAGGNVTNPPGVIDWAGGNIDWSSAEYKQNGYYAQEITKYTMKCPSNANDANLATVGSGTSPTGYVYTGSNSSDGHPVVQLTSSPISFLKNPAADGTPNTPGFAIVSSDTKGESNMWDGSGKSASGSSSSGVSWSKTPALRYGVIAGAAVVVLILIWALITRVVRARQHRKLMDSGARITGIGSGFGTGPVAAVAAATGVKKSETRYQPVGDGDDVPMGAAKQGQGYGPASGPSPSPMSYANARPSARDPSQSSAYSAGSGNAAGRGAAGGYQSQYATAEYDPYVNTHAPAAYAAPYSAPYGSTAYPNAPPPRSAASPAPTQHSASTYAQPYTPPQYGYAARQAQAQQYAPQAQHYSSPQTRQYAQQGGGYGYSPGPGGAGAYRD